MDQPLTTTNFFTRQVGPGKIRMWGWCLICAVIIVVIIAIIVAAVASPATDTATSAEEVNDIVTYPADVLAAQAAAPEPTISANASCQLNGTARLLTADEGPFSYYGTNVVGYGNGFVNNVAKWNLTCPAGKMFRADDSNGKMWCDEPNICSTATTESDCTSGFVRSALCEYLDDTTGSDGSNGSDVGNKLTYAELPPLLLTSAFYIVNEDSNMVLDFNTVVDSLDQVAQTIGTTRQQWYIIAVAGTQTVTTQVNIYLINVATNTALNGMNSSDGRLSLSSLDTSVQWQQWKLKPKTGSFTDNTVGQYWIESVVLGQVLSTGTSDSVVQEIKNTTLNRQLWSIVLAS